MMEVRHLVLFIFLLSYSSIHAQNISKLLIENNWSAYDNFAILDFQENGKLIIQYAYCSSCSGNLDTLEWELKDKLLRMGTDSLLIKNANSSEIKTQQYRQNFVLKNMQKLKKSKMEKEAILAHLISEKPLKIKVVSNKFDNATPKPIQFKPNGQMWLDMPKYRGQWAVKSFYGELFLIYINRLSVNRKFPILKIKSLKNGKLIGQPIPSIKKGAPFVLEISKN